MDHPDAAVRRSVADRPLLLPEAVRCLRDGGVIVYPTETFFALGCKVCDNAALQRVYGTKKRPLHMPLPVLAGHVDQLRHIAVFDPAAEELGARFWPGPLTLLLPAAPCVPALVTAGTGRIAVRISSHPTAQALAEGVGEALVSSSANVSGQPAARRPQDLSPALTEGVDGCLVEGPAPAGGLPSTLVEMGPDNALRIRRQGAVAREALEGAGYTVIVA